MPLSQANQFNGATAWALYRAYLSSAQHAAMTVDGTYAATYGVAAATLTPALRLPHAAWGPVTQYRT